MRCPRAGLCQILLAVTSVLLAQGCATVFRTRTPPIPVTSSPAPSTVSINQKLQGQTPIEIRLARRRSPQVIRIESPGCNPLEIQVGRDAAAPNYLGDTLLGAAAGSLIALAQATAKGPHHFWTDLAIDVPAGAAIRILVDLIIDEDTGLRTRELLVTLTKAGQPPRVETMVIDAKAFKDVKWIRVRRD